MTVDSKVSSTSMTKMYESTKDGRQKLELWCHKVLAQHVGEFHVTRRQTVIN